MTRDAVNFRAGTNQQVVVSKGPAVVRNFRLGTSKPVASASTKWMPRSADRAYVESDVFLFAQPNWLPDARRDEDKIGAYRHDKVKWDDAEAAQT